MGKKGGKAVKGLQAQAQHENACRAIKRKAGRQVEGGKRLAEEQTKRKPKENPITCVESRVAVKLAPLALRRLLPLRAAVCSSHCLFLPPEIKLRFHNSSKARRRSSSRRRRRRRVGPTASVLEQAVRWRKV
jgi:hypothetical protein